MTTRDAPFAAGTPCWVDLLSSDPKKSTTFYGGVLGWEAQETPPEFGGYVNFLSDGYRVAGMMAKPEGSPASDGWNTYISTDDIVATTAAVESAGGSVQSAPMRVGDLGTMAIVADSVGALVGLWQPESHIGFTKYNEPGSVTWNEFHSTDFPTTVAFYEKVFGWQMDKSADSDAFRYYQAQVDGQTVAGLMDSAAFLPPGVPSHWAVYFSVTTVDEAVQRSVALGGTVVRPAQDTPFGRMADLLDSTGASFKVHSANIGG